MKTEDLHDPGGFYIEYPVYVLSDPDGGVMFITGSRGRFLPVFTDTDTAERFIEDRPLPGHHPSDVPTRDYRRTVLDAAAKAGVEYVTLDPPAMGNRSAATFPLAHFLNCLGPAGGT